MNHTSGAETLGGWSGYSSVASRFTRKNRTQRTIDDIKYQSGKVKYELSQLAKDIEDNVLEYTKYPGPLTSQTIDYALKTNMWTGDKDKTQGGKQLAIKQHKQKVATSLGKSAVGFENMKVKFDRLDLKKKMDHVTVREHSQRINQILVVKRRRYENI